MLGQCLSHTAPQAIKVGFRGVDWTGAARGGMTTSKWTMFAYDGGVVVAD